MKKGLANINSLGVLPELLTKTEAIVDAALCSNQLGCNVGLNMALAVHTGVVEHLKDRETIT